MTIRLGTSARLLYVGALAMALLSGCGSDDDTAVTTTTSSAPVTNAIDVEMVDYGYAVKGKLQAGLVTVASRNSGEEMHMAGLGKLKAGKTVQDVIAGAAKATDGAFLAEFINEEIDSPGHILTPGQSQSLTVDVLGAGDYVMLCFIPTEGEGKPHFTKGMVAGFTVGADRSAVEEPEADATITLPDDAEPVGVPADLKAGTRTLKLTSTGAKGKDFMVARLNPGKEFGAFDSFFTSEYEKEGGPAKGAAKGIPGTIFGNTFEINAGQTIWMTVELTPGETYFVNTTNNEEEDGEAIDKFVMVTVS